MVARFKITKDPNGNWYRLYKRRLLFFYEYIDCFKTYDECLAAIENLKYIKYVS